MRFLTKAALGLLLLLFGSLLLGCSMESPRDTSIPWNRPADWEGQIPGMEGMNNTH